MTKTPFMRLLEDCMQMPQKINAIFWTIISVTLFFQMASAAVPRSQLPPAIQMALRQAENQFELTLGQDCPTEKCFSRGCVYLSHESVDQARSGSLPGLGEAESAPGAQGPSQEYLTGIRCELAFENTIPTRDISTLIKRLEQKLSRGYTTVTIDAKPLPALPATLRVTPVPAPLSAIPTPGATSDIQDPLHASKFKDGTSIGSPSYLNELWKTLLPHFGWMIAIALVTLAVVIFLWAFRRVGKASAEEIALQNIANETEKLSEINSTDSKEVEQENTLAPKETVEWTLEQEFNSIWRPKITREARVFKGLIHRWLREKEHGLTTKFAILSQEDFAGVLPEGAELTLERSELATYMTRTKELTLPNDDAFLKELKIGLAAIYAAESGEGSIVPALRKLKEQFGPEGILELLTSANSTVSATLFSLLPPSLQKSSAHLMNSTNKIKLAQALAEHPRASANDLIKLTVFLDQQLFQEGATFPTSVKEKSIIYGCDLHVGRSISILFSLLNLEDRLAFVNSEKNRFHGAAAPWMTELFYPQMILALKKEWLAEVFLAFDARQIALWLGQVTFEVRSRVLQALPSSLLAAVESYRKSSSTQDTKHHEVAEINDALAAALNLELMHGRMSLEEIL